MEGSRLIEPFFASYIESELAQLLLIPIRLLPYRLGASNAIVKAGIFDWRLFSILISLKTRIF
jgi:hypothetical protein